MIVLEKRSLADAVRELREQRGWTMGQLAAYADLSTSYVSKLEAGKIGSPAMDVLQRIAAALRVSPAALMGAEGPIVPADPIDMIREGLARLERDKKQPADLDLNDPELSVMLKEVGRELTDEERESIKPFLRRALERKRQRDATRQDLP